LNEKIIKAFTTPKKTPLLLNEITWIEIQNGIYMTPDDLSKVGLAENTFYCTHTAAAGGHYFCSKQTWDYYRSHINTYGSKPTATWQIVYDKASQFMALYKILTTEYYDAW
jgi:hypothetical protein